MPAEDEVDLRTISAEELEQINRAYEELEEKAREIEKTKNKIKADMAEVNAIAGGAPTDIEQAGGGATGGGGGGGGEVSPLGGA
ncbi:hypothetical protein LCGC14_2566450 [marine sediment metagenome]|uniref:Uncharacterized protein n=1 Tax=marine sediment metagenome TaxID=412755 RepID=A0A0F9AIG7_9ZZZZ